jgi:putative acetyltransferase
VDGERVVTRPGALAVEIRPEHGGDAAEVAAIADVVAAAFGSSLEATLVGDIRASENYLPEMALVAVNDGRIVGHVMISYVGLVGPNGTGRIPSLSPLAVSPDVQRRGVGSALVRRVIAVADSTGHPLVVLEGSPAYYSRLGFEHSRPSGIEINVPDWAPPEAAQVMRLAAYEPSITGTVVYPTYFDAATEDR